MKFKSLISIIVILAIGVFAGQKILDIETTATKSHNHDSETREHEEARGVHGGWLLSENNIRVEVKIFESGVPPQFRVYVTDASGQSIPLDEVEMTIALKRLDRVDEIHFKPAGKYLLGDKTVVEPHSFDVNVRARWKEKTYAWQFSQIEARVELSNEAIKNAGLKIKKAGPAKLKSQINLTGEIELNEEKVVHIVPRLEGVAKKVFKDLGDRVAPGDILAIFESRELADTKINYLTAIKKSDLAKADMERETLLYKNTTQMLDLLGKNLELDNIYHELDGLLIGKSRELLIPAYAKLRLAKSVYLREKILFGKKISSHSEYLQAEESYRSREAKYIALREKIAYDGQWAVRQKKRDYELQQLNLQSARQKLFALGLTHEKVSTLSSQEEESFTRYELRSPLGGVVIQKHLSTGEAVKGDDAVFLLADLSEVWVNITIPDIQSVKLGQKVIVKARGMQAKGKLTYLDSIVDKNSRTITGRVVIPNSKLQWRPGTFVTVELLTDERRVPLAVPTTAIQTIRDWSVVFVKYGNFFEARPLILGKNDGYWVEVLEGLSAGELYVAKNSFVVKAEIEKSAAVHDH